MLRGDLCVLYDTGFFCRAFLFGSIRELIFISLIVLNVWNAAALVENGKFLLAARKCRRATSTDYIISINSEDMSRGSTTYVGKLR
jgi:hypothetical protein